jgi:hypothetical protein
MCRVIPEMAIPELEKLINLQKSKLPKDAAAFDAVKKKYKLLTGSVGTKKCTCAYCKKEATDFASSGYCKQCIKPACFAYYLELHRMAEKHGLENLDEHIQDGIGYQENEFIRAKEQFAGESNDFDPLRFIQGIKKIMTEILQSVGASAILAVPPPPHESAMIDEDDQEMEDSKEEEPNSSDLNAIVSDNASAEYDNDSPASSDDEEEEDDDDDDDDEDEDYSSGKKSSSDSVEASVHVVKKPEVPHKDNDTYQNFLKVILTTNFVGKPDDILKARIVELAFRTTCRVAQGLGCRIGQKQAQCVYQCRIHGTGTLSKLYQTHLCHSQHYIYGNLPIGHLVVHSREPRGG